MRIFIKFIKEKLLEIAVIAIVVQLVTGAFMISLGNSPILIGFSAIVLVLLIVLASTIYDVLSRRKVVGKGDAINIKRKGIIFTVGLKSHEADRPLMKVIRNSSFQYYGFIGTEKTSGVVRAIVQAAGLIEDSYREKKVVPTNILETTQDTTHLILWMIEKGLSKNDIVVDLTGGTSIMSVAAYIAADENKIDTQYVFSDYDESNKPINGKQEAVLVSKYSNR